MALRTALARQFPGERVRWVIFSHDHLDHVRGSAALQADAVIGHRDVNLLVGDWHGFDAMFGPRFGRRWAGPI
jgi:glyoxylase-like metal-dependent hydrolase (beta-lactamase superfamily II)